MASQEFLDRVQQLYVAYYGRPADQEGLEYWAGRVDEEGESAIINAFGNSEEYAALAEGQGNATLVNSVYLQAFGRNADPEGLAYYTGVLERGEKSLAEIATTIINAAGGIDKQTFDARVKAAAEYTAEFGGDDYDLEAAKAAIEAAKPGVDASALTEALGELKAAQDAREDFLEGAYEGNSFVKAAADTAAGAGNEPTADQIDVAIGDEYTAAAGDLNTGLGDAGLTDFEERSASLQDAAIQEGVENAEEAISDYQEAISEIDGLAVAIRNYNRDVAADAAATTQEAVATAAAAGQTNAFIADDNGVTAVAVDPSGSPVTATTADGTIDIMTVVNGNFVVAAEHADLAGINALRDALQAEANAATAATAAANKLVSSTEALSKFADEISASDMTENAGEAVATELGNREKALSDLNDAIERFEAARELRDELKVLNDNAEDALEAIEDAEDGLGVDVWTAADTTAASEIDVNSATDDVADDVILFSKELDGFTIENFGNVGEDRLFFGDEYSFVELDGAWKASADNGDASALEIFMAQNGANLELYVENKAFAGNGTTDGDLTVITLTGVSADDVNFANGYLTAGEPA